MARLTPQSGGGLPVGMPLHLPLENLPKNCVLLDGSSMPDWASKAVKDMYGDTLPDYRGRTPVGTNEGTGRIGAGWADTPGDTGGKDRHTLTENQMPSHNHGMQSDGHHSHSGSTNTTGNHGHDFNYDTFTDTTGTGPKYLATGNTGDGGSSPDGNVSTNASIQTDGAHNHSLNINGNGNHKHTIYNTGGGASHNNMQPSIAGRWIMKLR